MNYYKKLLDIRKIREALQDEESETLFDARINYMINRNEEQYYKVLDTLNKEWYCQEVKDILEKIDVKGIIIFGSGHDGRRIKKILEDCKYFPKMFCDSDVAKVGKKIDGIEVISINTLVRKYFDYLVIIGSKIYGEEMYHILISNSYPEKNILYPQHGIIVAQTGKQYFDVWTPLEKEVYVDGGAYNGDTVLDFVTWTHKDYQKIFIFEPVDEMERCISQILDKEKVNNTILYKNALWNKVEKLSFIENDSGSHISMIGESKVQGVNLDEIVQDEKITFIKMDIEGSELKALEGAKNTIMKNKPRLAICIYHKPEDIIELPLYILDLVPEYKFHIRHYCSNMWETVLYASIE